MEPEARFCTTDDGVRIAYCVEGDGPHLVCCPDAVGSFGLDHLIDDQMGFWRELWRGRRVVRYDMRGTGLSQRDVDDVSHDALVRDLDAVVRASGAQQFTLYGSTLSGPRAIAYAATHPDAVRRLLLHRTFARTSDVMTTDQVRNFAELARVNWKMAAQVFADLPTRNQLPDTGVRQAQVYVQSTSGQFVSHLLIALAETADVANLLPDLRVRTLVMHWGEDPMFPFSAAQNLAARIPNARLKPLSQGIMSYLVAGRINEVMDIINEFIEDGAAPAPVSAPQGLHAAVQTVLFTDIVGHTEMMQRLGDARGREVLREHERITRETLRAHSGTEIKTDGDSFMVSFASVTSAVECAVALQRAFASREGEPLHVRMGLNAGEPIEDGGDLFGATVILAARIKEQAGAGEILIPETVRGLLSGKQFLFSDRGEFVPKGFDDAVRLFEVQWREGA
jgi:class 3 adenylate cyclase/pimeloyl-ACP methyl ester carboxylesterase